MYSQRFSRRVLVTQHARQRMLERRVDESLLLDLIETGEARYKDERRLWIAKAYPDRGDNLLCVAAIVEARLIVKTVMHHFTWEPTK
jgi:hypothetical protein